MKHPRTLVVRLLRAIVLLVFGLLLIFEEWGWEPLSRALARMARWPLWSRLEAQIVRFPPWLAMLTFAVPTLMLIPVKLLALYWLAQGHFLASLMLVLAAKLVGTALVARLFTLTRPTLMQLPWFASTYLRWKHWKDIAIAHVRHSAWWLNAVRLKAQWASYRKHHPVGLWAAWTRRRERRRRQR